MMKRLFRQSSAVLVIVLLLLSLASCGRKEPGQGSGFFLYYREQSERTLYPVEAAIDNTLPIETQVSSVWSQLTEVAGGLSYISVVPENVKLLSFDLVEKELVLNFSAAYAEMSPAAEVLFRAAVVRTFSQLPDVSGVQFMVEGSPLLLSDGSLAGSMHAQDFVDVIGSGLNAYTRASVTLYFADETGEMLVPVTKEGVYRNSYTIEQYVVRSLLAGPEDPSYGLATLPADLKLLSVRTQNGVCYVSFSEELVNETLPVPPAVAVYSVVNSLTELKDIRSVQLSVNGVSDIVLMNEIPLDQPLQRNLNYVIKTEKE
ncbi:MAG: GerMN domain-containing protein [Lachnospiraceae bacterium]|nr:GerMN domain-containing protein [Lachnospiraceae bacterium]